MRSKPNCRASDIIYVNAGVVAPPRRWLDALRPGGRLVFPWRPSSSIGLAVLATRQPRGFAVRIIGGAWFIPCSGASNEAITIKQPGAREARRAKAIVPATARRPDASAVAIYPDVWFSSHAPDKGDAG